MTYDIVQLTQEALWLMLLLSAPFIIGSAIIGLFVAFIQAITQLQEQSLGFAIKLGLLSVLLFLSAGLVGETLNQYTSRIFASFPTMAGP